MADPFGRAIQDHARGDRTEPLYQRDGERVREHPIEEFYFEPPPAGSDAREWLGARVEGPVLDVGAGAGRLALQFQDDHETVALEVGDALVATMAERGVEDPRRGDMFALAEQFEADRFRSLVAVGTQLGLARSRAGVEEFLGDAARVTTEDATLIVDNYDPAAIDPGAMLGHRSDVRPGLAFRVMTFEYGGERGEILLFRLFGPDRLREAAAGTPWSVRDVRRSADTDRSYYRTALRKE